MQYSSRGEAHVHQGAVSHTNSRAWGTSCPAATHAIPATAAFSKPSVTAAAWTTPANTDAPSTRNTAPAAGSVKDDT